MLTHGFLFSSIVALVTCAQQGAPHWSYSGNHSPGPLAWGEAYPTCSHTADSRQSPINIDSRRSVPVVLDPWRLTGYDEEEPMEMYNNGHTVKVNIKASGVRVSGGGLPGEFEADHFHMHWGAADGWGSEHTIDGLSYPMEVHIVHWNTKYDNISQAVPQEDGLAVLGFMFEISDVDNMALNPIVSKLKHIVEPHATDFDTMIISSSNIVEQLQPFSLASLLPSNLEDFYRYPGSLTTPGCFQSVTWTVFKEPIPISQTQMAEFRKLNSSEANFANTERLLLVDNYRPVQPLNKRTVHSTFLIGGENHYSSAPGVTSSHLACWIALVASLVTGVVSRWF